MKNNLSHKLILKLTLGSMLAVATTAVTQADTLRDVYLLALKNDAKLQAAEASYRADREQEVIARSALLPQLSGTGQYQEQDTDSTSNTVFRFGGMTVPSNSNTNSDSESKSWGLQLNQALFDLSAWFDFQSGKETTRQAEAQLAADQQDLIVRTAQAYFDALRARDNLEATRAEERSTQRQLEQTQQRFDVGLIAITEVHEARAIYDTTLVQRLSQEGALATAMESLTVITNQEHGELWELKENFVVTPPEPLDRNSWVEFALANNLQLTAARYGAEATARNARSKKLARMPKLTASVNYTENESDGESTNRFDGVVSPQESDSEGTTISLNLQVPLYAGGRLSAQKRQAYAQHAAAQQRFIDLKRQTIRATRAQHIAVETDIARVAARRQSIVSAESALDATRAGYEVGTRNIVDVLQAQRSLYSAIRDYSNSRYDYVVDMLKLKQQAGTLSPEDINALEVWLEAPKPPQASERQSR